MKPVMTYFVVLFAILTGPIARAQSGPEAGVKSGASDAPAPNTSENTPTAASPGDDDWRFVWKDGLWWYYLPNETWMVHVDGQWQTYEAFAAAIDARAQAEAAARAAAAAEAAALRAQQYAYAQQRRAYAYSNRNYYNRPRISIGVGGGYSPYGYGYPYGYGIGPGTPYGYGYGYPYGSNSGYPGYYNRGRSGISFGIGIY